jgi:Zn-dependent M28 family amino/carboxypeptidase
MKKTPILPAIVILLAGVWAQGCRRATAPITPGEIETHLRFLSSDLLEGRGMGSRGIDIAALYQETVFRQSGLKPFFGSSYLQTFDLVGSQPDRAATLEVFGGPGVASRTYSFPDDFVVHSYRRDCPEGVEGELVYAGYLIQAPERQWDDIKGADLRGKVILCEVNEPGNTPGGIFDGEEMNYYGRWTYKFEKAAELGATGVLIIHNTKGAAYGWEVVQNSWSGESFFLPDAPQRLFFQGWVSGPVGDAILAAAGQSRAALLGQAETAGFRPVDLGLKARVRQKVSFRTVPGTNVAGVAGPVKPKPGTKTIFVSAHYDHFGRDPRLAGDQIYNGAVDNCAASSTMLALARYYGQKAKRLKVNIVFVGVTGEEQLFLGSSYFVRHLDTPPDLILADLNLEMTNVWGETREVYGIGAKQSDLDDYCRRAAERLGLDYIAEREGNLGYAFRSDQMSFLHGGIPAVWLHEGITSRGQDPDWIKVKTEDYKKNKYHKVTDEIQPDWDLRGAVQIARWAQEIITLLSEAKTNPQFKPTSSFHRAR